MQTHLYNRFSLLLFLFVGLSFRASAQVTALAKPIITVYLTSSGQATLTSAQIDAGSSTTTSCGPLTLSLLQDGMAAGSVSAVGNEYYNNYINTLDGPVVAAPANTVFVAVDFASYGTPTINPDGSFRANPSCESAQSKTYVTSKLLGRNTYSFEFTDVFAVFGDPCGGTRKRLAIKASYASSQITFTTAGTHTATLIATDACGNISSATPTVVNVVDTHCGNGEKYNLCHSGRQLCVDASALAVHLGHGDTYGACSTNREANASAVLAETSPNPALNGQFRVHVEAATDGPVQVSLYDMQGTPVSQLFSGQMKAGEQHDLLVNRPDLRQGLYLVRIQTGQEARSIRVEVQK